MKKLPVLLFLVSSILLGSAVTVSAYQFQTLSDTKVEGDIILGPTKTEFFLDPGETATKEIMITNRTGQTLRFQIEIEDFVGSRDPSQSIVLLGDQKGPYSLKDWLVPEIKEFTLEHGQRIYLPIKISIPQDAEPGGRYGAVFAAALPPDPMTEEQKEAAKGQVGIVSRAGSLFFVKVKGDVTEEGYLKSLSTKNYYEKGPINFQLLFENNGSIHLVPYGIIEIFNILGKKIDEIEIDPYFAMPDSLRLREISWDKDLLFGKYTALASINRGYQDIIDQKQIEFWVIPWKIVLTGIFGLFLLIFLLKLLFAKFEIRKKG